MSYATYLHLESYLEGFATNYYGSRSEIAGTISIDFSSIESDLNQSYSKLNTYLDSITRIPIIPIGTNPKNGSYNPFLIEYNCCDTIFTKLRSRHMEEYNGKLPEWMNDFNKRCNTILDDIQSGKIPLDTDTTNTGIGYPIKIQTNGFATLVSNWDSGYYSGSDFEKLFHIKITDVTGGKGFEQAQFSISEDDGYSYLPSISPCGTSWIDLQSGLQIRWNPPTFLQGTQSLFELNDEWKIICTPSSVSSVSRSSQFKTFGRG